MSAGGAILWWGLGGVGQDDADSKGVAGRRSGQQGDLLEADPTGRNERESSRHSKGAIEKNRVAPLKQRIAQQELLVQEKRNELVELAKLKGISNPGFAGDTPGKSDTPEDAVRKARAVQDFEDRKREYSVAKELLKKLNLELALEQAKAKPGAVAR